MQNIERLAYWALLLAAVATLFLSGQLRSDAEAALERELAREVRVEGLYDAGTGDVWFRVDGNDEDLRVMRKLCPQSRSF